LSHGWLYKFQKRHGLKHFRFHGKAASACLPDVKADRARIKAIHFTALQQGYELGYIYNMDETSFFFAATLHSGLAQHARVGKKQLKSRLTLAITVNATGTDHVEPLFIGKAKQPRSFQKRSPVQLNLKYFSNAKTWMTCDIFPEWISEWNAQLCQQGCRIILFVDNFSGHNLSGTQLTHIHMEFFGPNLTAHIQPCDAGIIKNFKVLYRRSGLS
jgi:hypothetical protein